MSEFKREKRYVVIKLSHLTESQKAVLGSLGSEFELPSVDAVVVEADWPEYEPVWRMIERRVSGLPDELAALREELVECKRDRDTEQRAAIEANRELKAAEQRNAELTKAIADAEYRADQGKVWNGMGWTYTGLHSHGQQKVLDILRAALKPTESGASE